MKNRENRKLDGEKIFSVVAAVAIILAMVVGITSIIRNASHKKNKNYLNLNVTEETTAAEDKVAENKPAEIATKPEKRVEPETRKPEVETKKPVEKETIQPVTEAPAADIAEEVTVPSEEKPVSTPVYNFGENSSLIWPVEGDIVIGYSMTNTIFFPTLNQYKCSPAICISAEIGEDVVCSAPGVVLDVYKDEITGTTMEISIGDGYKLVYGQLGDLAVGVGEELKAGDVIAKVAKSTKYYTLEGPNLYFMLDRDGVAVDPLLHLEEK